MEAENEASKLKNQLAAYQKDLDHLRALQQRYTNENDDLEKKIN